MEETSRGAEESPDETVRVADVGGRGRADGRGRYCHSAKREGKTPSFREAMHYKCKNCHMRTNKKVKGACQECHPNVRSGK